MKFLLQLAQIIVYFINKKAINQTIHVERLFKQIKEINKIKFLFLNREQLTALSLFDKPIIFGDFINNQEYVGRNKIENDNICLSNNDRKTIVIDYFKNSLTNGGSNIDQKIYKELGFEIKNLIK